MAQQLLVNIEVGNAFILNTVYFSYLIFAPSYTNFTSYGGIIAQTAFSGVSYSDVSKVLYNPTYQILGLSQITLIGNEIFRFSSIIDQN